ncbi:FadR/GntR family transcriptional regulator [Rhizobium bangladeshense]|uniref:FadR family transcriptional regulator n=1 Tax=Rhizobium bangladeshense TaxID=1138189 RepID=A0ABS7LI64_9HYPH|nr:FadR/GntR family transcriptional regulator [Rhizobium bangladeshense]MBX4868428.1 FadR family transcriptional regulator [Rhizobium bangladeshense]MBX4875636.1 FadR family transcriptional regulator [Rhizobium bangladeshense]MBX4886522.1 FadR family transcriptional regulator [Rhizobium bangladeshense]MBX4894768.1 FadR family transcriptional regulator [Rhizobium bangladeshense]MBX4903347.1 FadR family transcriptional regulator [Rhizobium bangladeshense]
MRDMDSWLSEKKEIGRRNAAEAVFEDIRTAIVDRKLALGIRLPSEVQLAERYGISRAIIREALRSLQTLGFTQTLTGRGTFVVSESPARQLGGGAYSARDLMEARPCVEIPAAGWAALRRSDEQLSRLTSLCERMDEEEGVREWVRMDAAFHGEIAEASGNAIFRKVVADVRGALSTQSELVEHVRGRRKASNAEHRRILEAIAAGSEQDARAAMAEHLLEVKRSIIGIADDSRAAEKA